jgi:ATP phosphoribosyltransferase regulatory subunit
MAAETAKQFEALERQAQTLMAVFTKAGHEAVAPAMIQPADVFLDCIGESLRARTYVFTDLDGHELCLRPDLTVPTCRLHLARDPAGTTQAKYCYNGPTFRYQPESADPDHPREFRQAGIESFGGNERERAEAATLELILRALREAGLNETMLRLGDLGLFRALLAAVEMPERWRQRLLHQFWRPDAFRAELKRLTVEPGATTAKVPRELLAELDPARPEDAEQIVGRYLEAQSIELVGARSLPEITASLLGFAADLRAKPLQSATASLINRYVAITAKAPDAVPKIEALVAEYKVDIRPAIDCFDHRLAMLANAGIDMRNAAFAAEFGRNLEYYTGLVFEVLAPCLGPSSPVAGGGRYDSLMRAVGAPTEVPAVGAAIHTERLLAAVAGAGA